MLYTGYYAKTKKYEELGMLTVAVSGKVPDFYKGLRWIDVAPRWEHYRRWKDGEINDFEYALLYGEMLKNLDKDSVRNFIKDLLSKSEDVIFLCYEKSGTFCHRHILADYLENELMIGRVDEYMDNTGTSKG
jgi:uncharacterized protein YeaO (DUF488 family)